MLSPHFPRKYTQGFSLVEIAVVLFILTILIAMVAVPLASQLDSQREVETRKQLELAKNAITGFALVNGRLPCPALDEGAICTKGRECFCVDGTNGNPCTHSMDTTHESHGRCAAFGTSPLPTVVSNGFLPAATLGLSPVNENGYAMDAYTTPANRIYYSVARTTVNSIDFPFTKADGMKSATPAKFSGSGNDFIVVCPITDITCTTAVTSPFLAKDIPYVLYSRGKNAPEAPVSAAELANQDATTTFVSSPRTQGFDDILTWESIHTLFQVMSPAGKL